MLVEHLLGESGIISLAMEQGDIEKWDDMVVEQTSGTFKHVQVKRQTTDFCNKSM
jgi:hypothetical protein